MTDKEEEQSKEDYIKERRDWKEKCERIKFGDALNRDRVL